MNRFDDDDYSTSPDEGWKDSFTDLSLLLMTFFVLLVSISSMEVKTFESIFGSIRDAFGGTPYEQLERGISPEGQADQDAEDIDALRNLQRLRQELLEAQRLAYNAIQTYISANQLEDVMSVLFDDSKVVITVPENVLFKPGSEVLLPEAEPVLRELLAMFLDQRETNINIKGYSDNSPVPLGARFNDNWELSALRAVNVLRWFVDEGIPVVRLTATGMGDLDPLYPNDSPENRARNRRVEFNLERNVGLIQNLN